MELDLLSLLQQCTYRHNFVLSVNANDVSNQEVPPARIGLFAIYGDTDVWRLREESLLQLGQFLVDGIQSRERGPPVQLDEYILFAAADVHRLADGPTPLGHDCVHLDITPQGDSHGPFEEACVVEEKGILPRLIGATRHSSDLGTAGKSLVQAGGQVLGWAGEGLGQ